MSVLHKVEAAHKDGSPGGGEIEASIHAWGERIFGQMDSAGTPSLFSKKGFYGALMDWALRDEHFKTQLFRFVDVLPTLTTPADVARHLQEYLGEDAAKLSPALRVGLKAARGAPWLLGAGVKNQVIGLARQFMLGNDLPEIAATLRGLHEHGIAFSVDVLGEAVVSETEAEQYAQRYLALMEALDRELSAWPQPCRSNVTPRGPLPPLNLSVKLSALYSQNHPADPETALERIAARLRPILRRAKALTAFINLDMESYALKDVTLRLFKTVFAEPEFSDSPACGLALQAYLKESEADLKDLIDWARAHHRRMTVRLVKGAYWDYEITIARQRRWPVPVFESKAQTDANFEKLTVMLLENHDIVDAAFGTHNVRSAAHALAQAERLGLEPRQLEFQTLYGMAESLRIALVELGCRMREYCPVGELLPGMAYLVRRLLENTSNEGCLVRQFAEGASREELLQVRSAECGVRNEAARVSGDGGGAQPLIASEQGERGFENEPHTDFTRAGDREWLRAAIQEIRPKLGQRVPLVINNRPVSTESWLPSLNPANQDEVIGHTAQATCAEADLALAAARAAQPDWAYTPAPQRAALLEKVATLMRRDKPALCALEILEAGKNWTEADADVAEAIDFCNYYAAVIRELGRPHRTRTVPGESNLRYWRPRGVGVIIAPWNFPLAILTGMTSAAFVGGNTVIMKPSDQTPVIGARLMQLFLEAGLPAGVLNLLTGPGGSVGAHLVAHPQIDFIAFTGSREVGLKIWETAGRTVPGQANLKKVVCEMGGKNCIIVDSDADLDEAVTGCIASAFGYQGQKCSALSRLIVLADNYDRFLERFLAAAASMRVGPAEKPGNFLGPVISPQARQRILAMIDAGKQEAKLAWQGPVPDDPKACYVPPTVFTEVPPDSRLFREEIFGPVLAVTRAKDFTEALALANHSSYALTGGCYSRSPANLERARAELVCGNLYLNRPITGALVQRQPFGGFKMSGVGTQAGGNEYLQHFLVPRVVSENCLRRGFAPSDE